jgi:hypothetical protein
MAPSPPSPAYYKFDVGQLPDDLYHPEVPVQKWLETTITAGPAGFPSESLNVLHDIPWDVDIERMIGIALYLVFNILPFMLPLLSVLAVLYPVFRLILGLFIAYVGIMWCMEVFFFFPHFAKKYALKSSNIDALMNDSVRSSQFVFTERNITKYLSTSFVWPASMHRPSMEKTPVIFCAIPHGVGPIGITAYPLWSCLWNDKVCHWTCAPFVLKLPYIAHYMMKIGYIPAEQRHILETLTKKEENVGVVLDGIDGMFQPTTQEYAFVKKRKGIVKIALKAGVPLVPVYGFGHTALWTVVVDPFGLLEKLSNKLQVSLTPFFGRYGWFLGPPRRIPIAVVLGEPVVCPRVDEPTQEQVDKYHQLLLDSYAQLFEKHKGAYGWGHKKLLFV